MNLVNRLQIHYGWTPNFHLESKKQDRQEPSWIVLSHENNKPICSWITPKECVQLPIVLDERLFGDTIFKAVKTSDGYNIQDVWMYNSSCIYAGSTFKQRSEWLTKILKTFHNPILTRLFHTRCVVTVRKGAIPDVYMVDDGYIQIPDLKTSRYLRSKGNEFEMECEKQGESWIIRENIPDLK